MVNNFTANQIGDVIYAKLENPYLNVQNVLSWSSVVGVSTPNTRGTLNFVNAITTVTGTNTNLNLSSGDQFIVGNEYYTVDQVIDANTFTVTDAPTFTASGLTFYLPEDANNLFTYQYRWSQGEEPGEMSQLLPLTTNNGPYDLLGLNFDPDQPLWIELRLEVDRLSNANEITLLSLTYELSTAAGTIISCPEFCGECVDPYAMTGCANIIAECTDEMWNPYALNKPSSVYRQITDVSTEMWGHPVKYFRVEPDNRSRDVILKEYSLYNVVESAELKIMVPGNEFPTREFNYDIFGMGFDDFEIHLTKTQFENAFGIGPSPRSRDYLYFPRINRMYEVNTVAYADEFNLDLTYWKLMLRKYEERTSNIHEDTQVEQELADLTVGQEEVFGEERQEEFEKVTKPTQYKTVFAEVGDGVRARLHKKLTISDAELRNQWTVVSKNNYDLDSTPDKSMELVAYNKVSSLTEEENLAVTIWFRPKLTDTSDQIIIDGHSVQSGLKIATNGSSIKVFVNDGMHTFGSALALENNVWYGLVYNLSNKYKQMSCNLYRLDPNSNRQAPSNSSKTLVSKLNQTKTFTNPYTWSATKNWMLQPAKLDVTNIRIFGQTVGQDQQMNVLQQYVVRDSQLAHVIDNAIPSIQLRRYNQSR
jgi:hypothetical protein